MAPFGKRTSGWPVTCKREVRGGREREELEVPGGAPGSQYLHFPPFNTSVGGWQAACSPPLLPDTSLAHRVGIFRGLPSGYGIRSCLMWIEAQLYSVYLRTVYPFLKRLCAIG